MSARTVVAVLYVLGSLTTVTGLWLAYWKAKRDKGPLDQLKDEVESLGETDLMELFEAALGSDTRAASARAQTEARADALERAKERAGVESPGPTVDAFALPLSYFARHSALTDAVASFRVGGSIAIAGILVSTVASVWSLYL